MVSYLKCIDRKGRPGPEVCVYGNSPQAKTKTHALWGMRLNVGLRPNRAHLLLGMCIIGKIGVCGIAGQIYCARGFD